MLQDHHPFPSTLVHADGIYRFTVSESKHREVCVHRGDSWPRGRDKYIPFKPSNTVLSHVAAMTQAPQDATLMVFSSWR